MRRVGIVALASLVSSSLASAQQGIAHANALHYVQSVHVEKKVAIPMDDSVDLDASIYFPTSYAPGQTYGTVLIRTPYFFPQVESNWAEQMAAFLKSDLVVVLENERGRYWSGGHYTFLAGAKKDGFATVEWLARQAWSNGRVGTFGCSSSAEHQMGLSSTNPPNLTAMIPMGMGAGIGKIGPFNERGNFYRGGVFQPPWLTWYYSSGFNTFPTFRHPLSRAEKLQIGRFYDLHAHVPPVDLDKAVWGLPIDSLMDRIHGLPSDYNTFIRRLPNDTTWHQLNFFREGDRWGAPALWVDSWYDISLGPNLALYGYVQDHSFDAQTAANQFLIIAPTPHCEEGTETADYHIGGVGGRDVGDARFNYTELFVKWFGHWLEGEDNGVTSRPKVTLYTMGLDKWQQFQQWPPAGTHEDTLYLHSDGHANSRLGTGRLSSSPPGSEPPDDFVYDPLHPVPSLGGTVCCFSKEFVPGSFDQVSIEMRNDVLVYSTPPLKKAVEVTGPVHVILFLSSDVKDTDLTAKLLDVYPDGRAYNLDESIQRVRWRDGYAEPKFMQPGKVYRVEVGPLNTSNLFKAGHRIRIEISSSNFPRFARNLNTGGNNYDESKPVTAHNEIHHSRNARSRVVLSVLPNLDGEPSVSGSTDRSGHESVVPKLRRGR